MEGLDIRMQECRVVEPWVNPEGPFHPQAEVAGMGPRVLQTHFDLLAVSDCLQVGEPELDQHAAAAFWTSLSCWLLCLS